MLFASYAFYATWDLRYLVLLLFITFFSWAGGAILSKEKVGKSTRRLCLTVVVGLVLSVLAVFKYYVMAVETANTLSLWTGSGIQFEPLQILMPIGISFYTFQAISYVVDVYKERVIHEKNLGQYALYIAFFPKLLAGPIERAGELLPQFKSRFAVNLDNITEGFALILWGFFKKIVVADRLVVFVDAVYSSPETASPYQLLVAMYFFSFQIYCDFSGYTDIARGSAKLFGIDLVENFRQPYFSSSVREFWGRWHISLSSWFRDYLYIPLGGSRVSSLRLFWNLLVVFMLCGLWHGASWNFVMWGAIHGVMLCLNHALRGRKLLNITNELCRTGVHLFKVLGVFHMVSLAWVFFRFQSFSDAWLVVGKIFTLLSFGGAVWQGSLMSTLKSFVFDALPVSGFFAHELMLSVFFVGFLLMVDFITRKSDFSTAFKVLPLVGRWFSLCLLLYVIVIFGWFGLTEFIYFNF